MRIKTYVVEVKKTTKGPQVLLSRTRTGLLKRLFELEVPEIQDGIVELKSVAREPGHRSKIAVYSHDHQIDPVGACVGSRGIRVQMIVRELKGEKIDVIPWSVDPIEFIINALSPAKVSDVKILPTKKTAIVIVPDFQLSLAIGKEGQNARLAAKLTGWKIDIKSETQAQEQAEEIERLVYEEIGFRDQDNDDEVEEGFSIEEDILETEEFPVEDEIYEAVDETEVFEEDYVEPIVHSDEEEEEKVVVKKKNKKSKAISKQLARIELDDEPISLDDGYFFSDVLEERAEKLTEDEISIAKRSKKADEIVNTDFADEGVVTIGQLFGEELKKVQKAKKKDKGE
jgi:N utilization substance protein A